MLFIFFSEKDELEHKFASRVIFEAQWEMNGSRDIALHTPPIPRTSQTEQFWYLFWEGFFFIHGIKERYYKNIN